MTTLRFRSPVIPRGAFTLTSGEIAPAAGRVTVLIGPNGGGKTTALRAAAGMLVPEQGAILLDGAPVHSMPAAERAARHARRLRPWPPLPARRIALWVTGRVSWWS